MDKNSDAEPHTNGVPVANATVLSFDPNHGQSVYPVADVVAMPTKGVEVHDTDNSADSKNIETVEQPQRDFSSGICDLFQSWTILCDACLCSHCIASAHQNFLMNETEGVHLPLCCGLLGVDLCIEAQCPMMPSVLVLHTFVMRKVLRERYNLRDPFKRASAAANTWDSTGIMEPIFDLLKVACCLACVLAQHQREIIYQGEWCGGVFSNRNSILAPTEVHTL